MNERPVTFEMLNAYVDGELDAAAAAEAARAVAADPVLASQVVALSKLRSAVADSVEAPPLTVPAVAAAPARLPALAASLLFALFVAGSALVSAQFDHDLRAGWLDRALQLHQSWSIATSETGSGPLLAEYADAVPGAYIPDLTASRLTVAHAAVAPFSDSRRALIVGYKGSRGCKVSLVVFPGGRALGETIEAFMLERNHAYAWRAGKLAYVILTDSMDATRFRQLAESVRLTSRRHLPFDRETQMALRKSRDTSKPCMA
jgi:anti-sigma factor RsiW